MNTSLTRRSVVAGLTAGAFIGPMGGTKAFSRHSGAGQNQELPWLDIGEAARAIRSGKLSPVELTEICLDRIAQIDARLNSFITVMTDQAMSAARNAERVISNGGWRGPLHGIPIGLKDNIDTAGVRTTAASAVYADRVPTRNAEVVRRLKQAGAVIIGKQNMHEFAQGTSSVISRFGPVHNPWDFARVAGGSSGGSAAAVAAGLCFGSVGTDTGGSIRIPASCCGVVGFKPTFGTVSQRGVIPVSTSFDHVGPIARSVADVAFMLASMSRRSRSHAYNPWSPPPVSQLRVGVLRNSKALCDADTLDPDVSAAFEKAIVVLTSLVAGVRDAELPNPQDLGRLIDFEAYAYHAANLKTKPRLYDPRTLEILRGGADIRASEATNLARDLTKFRSQIGSYFSDFELTVLPTLPTLPPLVSETTEPFALHACTFAFSLGGLPSISIPCGRSRSGLPIGMLIGGPPKADHLVLALAQRLERALGKQPRPALLFAPVARARNGRN